MKSKSGIKNFVLGVIVGSIISCGIGMHLSKDNNRELTVKSIPNTSEKETKLEDPKLERVIVYKDGSMRLLLDFPEGYDIDEEPYLETRPDDILYTEIYNDVGEKETIYSLESSEPKLVHKKK